MLNRGQPFQHIANEAIVFQVATEGQGLFVGALGIFKLVLPGIQPTHILIDVGNQGWIVQAFRFHQGITISGQRFVGLLHVAIDLADLDQGVDLHGGQIGLLHQRQHLFVGVERFLILALFLQRLAQTVEGVALQRAVAQRRRQFQRFLVAGDGLIRLGHGAVEAADVDERFGLSNGVAILARRRQCLFIRDKRGLILTEIAVDFGKIGQHILAQIHGTQLLKQGGGLFVAPQRRIDAADVGENARRIFAIVGRFRIAAGDRKGLQRLLIVAAIQPNAADALLQHPFGGGVFARLGNG